MAQTNIAAIILAAGRGERAGTPGNGPKQYRNIGGETVISRTISAFRNHPSVGQVIAVIHRDDRNLFNRAAGTGGDNIRVVEGGDTRQASTLAGLRAFSGANSPEYVLIHDAARPFVSESLLSRIAGALEPGTGVLPALPVSDTIKRSTSDGMVGETVLRDGLFAAQTPQAFPFEAILSAHESSAAAGHDDFTDDAAIAEWAGIPVKIIAGDAENIKLTWAKDIEMADMQLSSPNAAYPDVRTGSGYDVHAFGEGDHVVLCGVEIPFDRGLSGHSDADAGLHALTDALLATCSSGDIGSHFPPTDPQWKGAGSHIFLRHAADIVRGAGGRIANADITIICEAPRIGPHRDAMVSAMAGILQIEPVRISVKATTNEKLGFVGREEGIAAIASVSVVFPGEVPQ